MNNAQMREVCRDICGTLNIKSGHWTMVTGFLEHAARAVQLIADTADILELGKAEFVNVQVKLDALADEFSQGIE